MFAQPDLFNHVSLLSDHAWSIYFLYGQGLCSLNADICACLTGDWMCRQVNCLIIALQFSLQQLLHIILSLFLSELKCFVKKCDTSFCGFDKVWTMVRIQLPTNYFVRKPQNFMATKKYTGIYITAGNQWVNTKCQFQGFCG